MQSVDHGALPMDAAPADDVSSRVDGWFRLAEVDAAKVRAGIRAHVSVPDSPEAIQLRESGEVLAADAAAEKSRDSGDNGAARLLTVLKVKGQLRAFDSACYHAGGPLGLGDIEDVAAAGGDRACISCPWHHHLIDLETGVKWYEALTKDPSTGRLVPGGWKASAAPVQRIHEVVERDGGIFVRLCIGGSCPSDPYAHREDCARLVREAPERGKDGEGGMGYGGGDGRALRPSGQVLKRARDVQAGSMAAPPPCLSPSKGRGVARFPQSPSSESESGSMSAPSQGVSPSKGRGVACLPRSPTPE